MNESSNRNAAIQSTGDNQTKQPKLPISGRSWKTFWVAALGALLLWSAFPPLGFWPLGWIALIPMMWLIAVPSLTGRHPYRQIWIAGLIYWLVTFYFIPIPHWALWFGWLAVSLYLSLYLPLFVLLGRSLVHRMHWPTFLAGPLVWVGIEWVRCNLLTGMGMACLSHSQYTQPILIQVADLLGGYTLTLLMAMFAATWVPWILKPANDQKDSRWAGLIGAMGIALFVLGYGYFRLNENKLDDSANDSPTAVVGLIQGSIDTEFPANKEEYINYQRKRDEQYFELSREAINTWPNLNLMIWPESSFPYPDFTDSAQADNIQPGMAESYRRQSQNVQNAITAGYKQPLSMLVGTTSYGNDEIFNSAILLGPDGQVVSRYFKNHRVMFGEYVPFSEWFPMLQQWSPIGRGLTAGTKATSFKIEGITFSPNICFESTVPHLIRRQVNQLANRGDEPDALINITNDGWFYGTSCLDFHLACNVFRAVEMRKTNLVCANTGFSAEIDPAGRKRQTGPRRATCTLRAKVGIHETKSLYRIVGDIPIIIFGFGAMLLGLIGCFIRKER